MIYLLVIFSIGKMAHGFLTSKSFFPKMIHPFKLSMQDTASKDSIIFAGVKFPDPIASSLKSINIRQPSPIQQASIVALTTGQSAILHAETGSGKTLAYLLPLLKRLLSLNDAASRRCN